MAQKKKSIKPDRPIATIVFPQKGRPRFDVEHLPRTQDDLELSIGKKFAGSLAKEKKHRLANIVQGSGRGDLVCRNELGAQIKIQVVEVVDPVMTILSERRSSYRNRLLNKYADLFSLFGGCRINLINEGNEPFLPSIRTRDGKIYCEELASKLETLGRDINSLVVGKRRIRKWQIGLMKVVVIVDCLRFASEDSSEFYQLNWKGGRSVKPGEEITFLTNAISKKINKQYSKPKELFWLLAYSCDSLLHDDSRDMITARTLLNCKNHPFDAVWYLYPYSNKDIGHLVQVWPRQEPIVK